MTATPPTPVPITNIIAGSMASKSVLVIVVDVVVVSVSSRTLTVIMAVQKLSYGSYAVICR